MAKRKKRKTSNNPLKIYQQNRARAKGKLFEAVLKELLLKAGFSTDVDSDQITRNRQRIHGRGSTYDPDFFGVFRMGIPFVNPLMLVAEAKYYNSKVKIAKVREFLGACIDFSQYVRINTKAGGEKRYSVLYSPRYTYCPIFFSIKGFDKSSEAFMYAHGIYYISYENSKIMENLFKHIEAVLNKVKFSAVQKEDFKFFKDLNLTSQIRNTLKKRNFDNTLSKFVKYLTNLHSMIAVLDYRFPINLLYRRKIAASSKHKIKLIRKGENSFIIENVKRRKFGEFSLSNTFLKGYIQYAKKNGKLDNIFKQVDIIIAGKNGVELKQFIIDDTCRTELVNMIFKEDTTAQ